MKIKTMLILAFCLLVLACSKVNSENFNQIKPGMTMQEVVSVLGEPTSTESVNIAGISGTAAKWKDSQGEIDIQFVNDKVAVKAFSKPNEK